ncbi:MAG: type II toxin-antitoxin system prevent-host-death family antitoxin [Actinomycetota bacterium]|nr:type II toxin-antitoxin system prevent-host-death family antitoxin [Actinomycetota bacterium]
MSSVGIRELRQQASTVLRRVLHGERIEVTEHGRPIACIVPLSKDPLTQLIAEGRASEADGELLGLADSLATARRGGTSPSAALAELRADER